MPKLRKQRRRKVFRHSVNRKRMRNRLYGLGNIGCKEVKEAWEEKKSIQTNMLEMGLAYDPNKTIKIPNVKKQLKKAIEQDEWNEEDMSSETLIPSSKTQVVETLEAEAKAPRVRLFRLPKAQVEFLSYLILKYGKHYKQMAKDPKNYNQETWKQLRAKIKRFKSVPEQYEPFLKANGLVDSECESENDSDDEI